MKLLPEPWLRVDGRVQLDDFAGQMGFPRVDLPISCLGCEASSIRFVSHRQHFHSRPGLQAGRFSKASYFVKA
jgi:hypothetical protein